MTQETMILGKIFMFQAVPFCFLYNPANSFISKVRCKITKSSYKIQIYSHLMVIYEYVINKHDWFKNVVRFDKK